MTLTQLKYFCEVAKTRHFTAAANNLFVAQSSLSYAIRELEAELEAPLFIRRPNKHIDLTSYGKALLPYAEAGLKMLEDGKNEVISMRSPMQGSVKIGFFFSIVFTAVPYLIQCFKEDYPDSQIDFQTEVYHNWADLRELLLQGQCDFIISAGNITAGCQSKHIANHRIVVTVPKNHPFAAKESVSLEELAQEKLIVIDANSNMDLVIKEMFKEEGLTPHLTYVSDWTSQQLAVSSGKGLALSTNVPVDEKLLTKVNIDSPKSIMPLYLTWPTNRKPSQIVNFVKDYFIELSGTFPEDLIF
ncbi:LysR family transcriptional regulator [Anaerotignum sp.]